MCSSRGWLQQYFDIAMAFIIIAGAEPPCFDILFRSSDRFARIFFCFSRFVSFMRSVLVRVRGWLLLTVGRFRLVLLMPRPTLQYERVRLHKLESQGTSVQIESGACKHSVV